MGRNKRSCGVALLAVQGHMSCGLDMPDLEDFVNFIGHYRTELSPANLTRLGNSLGRGQSQTLSKSKHVNPTYPKEGYAEGDDLRSKMVTLRISKCNIHTHTQTQSIEASVFNRKPSNVCFFLRIFLYFWL